MKTNRKKKKTKKRSKRCRQSTQIKYQNMNISTFVGKRIGFPQK